MRCQYIRFNQACPSLPSLFGSNITRTCISQCNWGEYADITSRQCTRICPSGTYGDNSTRRCVSTCPSSQSTFADPLTRLCVRICPNNYYADTNTRLCVSGIDCSNNTYGDPVTQYCVEAKGKYNISQNALLGYMSTLFRGSACFDAPLGETL
jgi:ferredoxin-like protein FixX